MGRIPVADTAYLKRRRGKKRSGYRWYVCVPVPVDLQSIFRKRTIERALHTADFESAKKLKHPILTEIFADFDRARLQRITSADIEAEAQRYVRERIAELRVNPGDTFAHNADDDGHDYGPGALPYLDELAQGLADGEWEPRIKSEAASVARSYGAALGSEQLSELCYALQIGEIEAVQRALSIEEGVAPQPLGIIDVRAVDPITGAVAQPVRPTPKQGGGIRVREAGEAYVAEKSRRQRGAWTAQTRSQAEATLRLFEEHVRNAPLQSITRANVASFLAIMAKLDPNYGRHSSTGKMTLAKLVKDHPAPEGGGLSARTMNRHAAMIAGMFDWATRQGKYEGSNPAKGHHRSEGTYDDQEPARRTFTNDELKKLFAGPLYQVPNAERIRPAKHTAVTALAWLIPIGLFTGMRLDEICGLRVADVKEAEGVLHFDVTSHEGRRLKTAAARRLVPVHPELLRIGFGSYLDYVKAQGHKFLFRGLSPGGPDEKRSWYVGRRFTAYRRSVGAGADKTTFHCFRKNVSTALERARIPEAEAARIVGHRFNTMTYGLYSGGLDLKGLERVVEAICYPGLDLSRLYRQPLKTRKARSKSSRCRQNKSPALATEAPRKAFGARRYTPHFFIAQSLGSRHRRGIVAVVFSRAFEHLRNHRPRHKLLQEDAHTPQSVLDRRCAYELMRLSVS